MRTMKHFALATTAAAALALAGCGGGGSGASGGGANGPGMTDPMPVAAMGSVMLDERAQAAFMEVLPDPGDSDMVEIAAGMSVMRQGVTFTCDSAYPCTVTVTNSLGTITASWSSQTLGDGMADVMASLPPPPHVPVSTFADLNMGNTETMHGLVTTPTLTPTELTGMGLGGAGVANADMAGLRSSFDPNTADADGTAGGPGAINGLTGGSTLTGATDGIDASPDMAPAPSGWVMKTLFRDWGDTAGMSDGGFETGAIVVKNHEGATSHPWDAMLAGRFANGGAPYSFTVLISTGAATTDAANMPNDAVSVDPASDAGMAAQLTVGAPQLETLTTTVADESTHRGTYLGVSGTFRCSTSGGCSVERDTGGSTPFGLAAGTWHFKPDDNMMVSVPDQDWMVYGAWMTTPDVMSGVHRIGTFANGFDTFTHAANEFAIAEDAGLHGTAEYSGGAAGIYVDGEESGLFTATASLMANFDVDGDGTADAGDYTISGRIDDFRGTDGVYLGTDTAADPNDPNAGGENDWVVMLGSVDLTALTDGAIPATSTTSGSADGVPWTGTWSGQLYGPAEMMPSGVAGQFNAMAPDTDTTAEEHQGPNTAVTGAFGAAIVPPAN